MICKGCGKKKDWLSLTGFCSDGICQLKEEGYVLGWVAARQETKPPVLRKVLQLAAR